MTNLTEDGRREWQGFLAVEGIDNPTPLEQRIWKAAWTARATRERELRDVLRIARNAMVNYVRHEIGFEVALERVEAALSETQPEPQEGK